ncbi:Protein CBG27574 [Caenorhabditis briggsae]|uniref:Protein CBG27574 n=1 Tax=Caenorhabditis briggsae TaxID=6238 RepID=B6IFR8_CAEBR|nr:Protein CBG27574 [Caenorhabditis briggsae]CAR98748.1 Protein CBG27574 [Caenorhabditis briggsae]
MHDLLPFFFAIAASSWANKEETNNSTILVVFLFSFIHLFFVFIPLLVGILSSFKLPSTFFPFKLFSIFSFLFLSCFYFVFYYGIFFRFVASFHTQIFMTHINPMVFSRRALDIKTYAENNHFRDI